MFVRISDVIFEEVHLNRVLVNWNHTTRKVIKAAADGSYNVKQIVKIKLVFQLPVRKEWEI